MENDEKTINNFCGVVMAVRAEDPGQFFIELKDDGYPMKVFCRHMCPIGGNWIGKLAIFDNNPLGTLRREMNEELCLEKPVASTLELKLLGQITEVNTYKMPKSKYIPTEEENKHFIMLKQIIADSCAPFGDYLVTVPDEVLNKDPQNKIKGYRYISSYWVAVLREKDWIKLSNFQSKFGNLSNESLTLITSLNEVIKTGTKFAFGHDTAVRDIFLAFGLEEAKQLPMVDGTYAERVGSTMCTYTEYQKKYDVLRTPFTPKK